MTSNPTSNDPTFNPGPRRLNLLPSVAQIVSDIPICTAILQAVSSADAQVLPHLKERTRRFRSFFAITNPRSSRSHNIDRAYAVFVRYFSGRSNILKNTVGIGILITDTLAFYYEKSYQLF